MVEKFNDYEGSAYIAEEGTFEFEVMNYELKDSKAGTPMAVFTVKAPEGQSTLYFSLSPKARWNYNKFIKACLFDKLDTPEKRAAFELDYETIGNDLIGRKFLGDVELSIYEKEVKKMNDDGTFSNGVVSQESYKITDYLPVE